MTYLLFIALLLACSWLAWRYGCERDANEGLRYERTSAEIREARRKYENAEQPKEEWQEVLDG